MIILMHISNLHISHFNKWWEKKAVSDDILYMPILILCHHPVTPVQEWWIYFYVADGDVWRARYWLVSVFFPGMFDLNHMI